MELNRWCPSPISSLPTILPSALGLTHFHLDTHTMSSSLPIPELLSPPLPDLPPSERPSRPPELRKTTVPADDCLETQNPLSQLLMWSSSVPSPSCSTTSRRMRRRVRARLAFDIGLDVISCTSFVSAPPSYSPYSSSSSSFVAPPGPTIPPPPHLLSAPAPSPSTIFLDSSSCPSPFAFADRSTPVVVRFKSIGSAPVMKTNVFKVTAGNKFQAVIVFLRSQLGMKQGDPLVSIPNLYISPGVYLQYEADS